VTAYVRTRRPELTAREVEVLSMIARGMTNAAIGRELGISEEAVKRRVRDIREVLGAVDRAHAVNEGWRQGYLGGRSRASKVS
jgi:DNA-binding CsgD family transcriptional regulator